MSQHAKASPGGLFRELRGVARLLIEVNSPITHFVSVARPHGRPGLWVGFDTSPPFNIDGLRVRVKILDVPEDRTLARGYELAKAIWHLKDWIKTCAPLFGHAPQEVEAHAAALPEMLVCADLANFKKHGGPLKSPRCDWEPRLGPEVVFDLSKSGLIEMYYDGARKRTALYVSESQPIPTYLPVLVNDGSACLRDDFGRIARNCVIHWNQLIQAWKLLDPQHPEALAISTDLARATGTR